MALLSIPGVNPLIPLLTLNVTRLVLNGTQKVDLGVGDTRSVTLVTWEVVTDQTRATPPALDEEVMMALIALCL